MNARGYRSRSWVPFLLFLYGVLIALLAAFVVYRRQMIVDGGVVDLNGFGAIARNLARGNGFSQGMGPTIRRGPLYPFLGAGILILFGHDAPGTPEALVYRPLLIGNCVILGITCVVVWSLTCRIFGSRTAVLAAMLCPLVPQSVRYVGMTEVETLMGLCVVLLAATGLSLAERPGARSGAEFGAVAAVATLAKPVVLLYPFVFLALSAWHWKKMGTSRRAALAGGATALACFSALLVPWTVRNMAVTDGRFKGISSNAPGEFLRGYVNAQPKYYLLRQDFGGTGPGEKWDPEANEYEENLLRPYGVAFYRPARDAAGEPTLTPTPPRGATSVFLELQRDRVESAEVRRRVLHEPLSFVRKVLIQLLTFWYIVETRAKSVLVGAIALITLAFATAGIVRAKRRGVVVWPVVAVVAYFNVLYAIFLAFARYSMPLFSTLTVLSAGGAVWLADVLKRRALAGRSRRPMTPGSA